MKYTDWLTIDNEYNSFLTNCTLLTLSHTEATFVDAFVVNMNSFYLEITVIAVARIDFISVRSTIGHFTVIADWMTSWIKPLCLKQIVNRINK